MPGVELLAPAKVNLFLAVGPRRPDGYHDLVTVFNAVSIGDRLEVTVRPSPDHAWRIEVSGGRRSAGSAVAHPPGGVTLPRDTDNLAGRAVALFAAAVGDRVPGQMVTVVIDKRVPVAAGLGGGSSDAAAVLRWLNRHLGSPLDPVALGDLAARLGSDVPFFLHGGRAVGRGRGEAVTPWSGEPVLPLVVGLPDFPLSTPEVYRRFDALHSAPDPGPGGEWLAAAEHGLQRLSDALAAGDLGRVAAALRNDLARPAASLRPEVETALDRLTRAGCLGAAVSGSGPTVFGLAASAEAAEAIAEAIAEAAIAQPGTRSAGGYRYVTATTLLATAGENRRGRMPGGEPT